MITKETATQDNLLDGTVWVFEPHEDGAYVTVAGRDGQVHIVAFDISDLKCMGKVLMAVQNFDPSKSSEDQARVTDIGVDRIAAMFKNGGIA